MDVVTEDKLRNDLINVTTDVLDEVVNIWTYPNHQLTNLWIENIYQILPAINKIMVDSEEISPSYELIYSSLWGDGWDVDSSNVEFSLWEYTKNCGFTPREDCLTNIDDLKEKVTRFYQEYAKEFSSDVWIDSESIRSILIRVGLLEADHPEEYDIKVSGWY